MERLDRVPGEPLARPESPGVARDVVVETMPPPRSVEPETSPQSQAEDRADDPDRTESLVIQTSFLGDAILTTPLIAELAMRGPVDVVVTPAAAEVLANNPSIRRLHVYDKRAAQAGLGGLWAIGRDVRGRRDASSRTTETAVADGARPRGMRRARRIAYLAQGSLRSAVLAMLAGCRERVGFDTSAGRALYTTRVPFRDDLHHAERLWRLAFASNQPADPPSGAIAPHLYPGASDESAVQTMLSAHHVDESFIAIAPGSAWATKRWPHYAELARHLATLARIVVVGSGEDRDAARAITEAAGADRVIDATGKLSLLGSAAMIARAVVIVTNDSSPLHLASAMGVPTIAIFGPTVPEFGFGPLAPESLVVGRDSLTCRPCHHHGPVRCPLGHWKCMRELGAEHVASLVSSQFALVVERRGGLTTRNGSRITES